MKHILFSFLVFIFAANSVAKDSVHIEMTVLSLENGDSAFQISWDEKLETALIAIKASASIIEQTQNNLSLDLKTDDSPLLLAPTLPSNCMLLSVDGIISPKSSESNLLYLMLVGKNCPAVFASFENEKIQISLKKVKYLNAQKWVEDVQMKFTNTPKKIIVN